MPLRFDLAPFEKVHIGSAVLTGSHERTRFFLDGDMPVLRDRDFLRPETAADPVERLYCCMQRIYLEQVPPDRHGYAEAMAEAAGHGAGGELADVAAFFAAGERYKALQALRKRIRPEAFVKDRSAPDGYVVRRPARA